MISVIGDIMLDEYIEGVVTRISPEAPVPIFLEISRRFSLGGAANVACGVAAMTNNVRGFGVVGVDTDAESVRTLLHRATPNLTALTEHGRRTTKKSRYVVGGHQLMRVDAEDTSDVSSTVTRRILETVSAQEPSVIILSDYAKGVLTQELCHSVIKDRRNRVIVDPKRPDWTRYAGAYLITPNTEELLLAKQFESLACKESEVVRSLMTRHQIANCLVTLGSLGMKLYAEDGSVTHMPAVSRDVVDVTGAGDTVVAVVAARTAAGDDLRKAVKVACVAAGIAVTKRGVYTVRKEEL
jgi:D-beta-D-heptose 7-phosphate kinase/D-beta-D-heptose 1-phosphate adenosyltransferase